MANNKKNRIIASSVTAALVASAVAPVASAAFKDSIPAYAKDAVEYVITKGYMNGLGGTSEFGTTKNITRAEVAVVIAKVLDLKTEGKTTNFADVPENHWASEAIAAVVEAGIAKGTGNGFNPAGPISRQEAAVMFANAYKFELNEKAEVSFNDENTIASWAKAQVDVLASLGIFGGKEGGVFAPTNLITRGEIAVLVHRAEDASQRLEVPTIEEELLKVESVNAINANQLKVIFDNEITVTIDLTEALEDGATTVSFEYNGQTFTDVALDAAYVAPDMEAPVLTIDGETTVNVVNGEKVVLPTVTAMDNKDKLVEVTSVITNATGEELESIDSTIAGIYTVTYSAVDAAGNIAENIVVTVIVAEEVLKIESVTAINANQLKVIFDNETTITIDLIEALEDGATTVSFEYNGQTFTDVALDAAYVAPDMEAPVLTIDGETTVNVVNGEKVVLPTVTAMDNKDKLVEVTSVITNAAGEELESIDSTVAGTYTVTYSAVDAAGNIAENIVVTVIVAEAVLKVESVSAINATTLLVTFEGQEEAVEVTLETPLTHGQTEVTFTHENVEYTASLTVAYADPAVVAVEEATAAVVAYEEATVSTYADVAIVTELQTATQTAVNAVADETENAELQVRIDAKAATVAAKLAAVVTTVNAHTNEVSLNTAISTFFLEVDSDLITAYNTAISNAETSVDDIQTAIYSVNVINAVSTASNEIQLLAALNKGVEVGVLTGVNADLISQYDAQLSVETSIAAIQAKITNVNTNAEQNATALATATAAVEALEAEVAAAGSVTNLEQDAEGDTAEGINDHISIANGLVTTAGNPASLTERMTAVQTKVNAISAVITAEGNITTTANFNAAQVEVLRLADSELKTALQDRLDAFAPVVAMNGAANVSAAQTLLTAQKPTGFATLSGTSKTAVYTAVWNTGTDYTTVAAYNKAVADAITEYTVVDAVNAATTEAGLLAALQAGEAALYTDETTSVFTADSVNSELSALYFAAINGYDQFGGGSVVAATITDAANIQSNVLDAINGLVNDAESALDTYVATPDELVDGGTAADLETAIEALPEGDLANAYNAQLLVGEAEQTLLEPDAIAAQTAVDLVVDKNLTSELQGRLDIIGHVVAVNAATGDTAIADVKAVLDTQLPTGYSVLSDSLKTKVATIVYNLDNPYTTVADYNEAIAAAIQLHTVNNAITATEALNALQPIALATTSSADYLNLSKTSKLEVAGLFLDNDAFASLTGGARTGVDITGDYTAVADVKTDLNALTSAYNNLFNIANVGINTADTLAEMVTALGAIGYDAFDNLDSVAQYEIAEAFLSTFPMNANGVKINYTTLANVKLAIAAAINAQ